MSPATASATTAAPTGARLPSAPRNSALPATPPTRTAPPLRVVRPRATAPRAPFVLLVSVLLGGGLVMVLLVNTWLAQGSFTVHTLTIEQSKYADDEQALTQSIALRAAPQALAAHAIALGMVPAPNPVFRRASDGSVIGAPTVAWAPPPPVVAQPSATPSPSVTPSPSASASPSPSASASPSASPAPTASATGSPAAGTPAKAPVVMPTATKPGAAVPPAATKPAAAATKSVAPPAAKPTATPGSRP
ncbi:MAG TPA: hypothetical protein VIL94_08170 [Acidothermaceae bacterium]